jgi:polysaccharide export outer membrane protein
MASPEEWPEFESFNEYRVRNGDLLEFIYLSQPRRSSEYRLQVGDRVELRSFAVPEITVEQVIRSDGRVTVPLAGELAVAGLTPAQATANVLQAYEGVLRAPDVFLVVKEFGAATRELKSVIRNSSDGQSKLVRVRPDGFVSLPAIGEVKVNGLTIADVTKVVGSAYDQGYSDLTVDVLLRETADHYVYVLGEVRRPGAYTIHKPVSVAQALALAGGNIASSRLSSIVIARRDGDRLLTRQLDLDEALAAADSPLGIVLRPDDVLFIPRRRLASAAMVGRELADLLLFRGWAIGGTYDLDRSSIQLP